MKGTTMAAVLAGLDAWPRTAQAADPVPIDRLMFGGTWEGKVGVSGSIPARTTIAQTLGPGATASQINTAIANCPAEQVVLLSAGQYTSGGTIVVAKNNVTLRGAVDSNGMPTTALRDFKIVIGNQNGWDVAASGNFTNANVTGGASRGSTTVTLSTTSGLGVGRLMWISAPSSSTVTGGGWSSWFGSRPLTQTVKVTGINGSSVSFTPALNPDYLSGSIQAHWRSAGDTIARAGVENLNLTTTSGSGSSTYVGFYGSDECFAKNIKTDNVASGSYHFYLYANYRPEIRHCDASRMVSLSSSTYCILALHTSCALIEDNYFHNCPNVMPMFGLNASAFSYNYVTDLPYNPSNWLSQIVFFHGSHNHYNLFEGNWSPSSYNDSGGGSRNNLWFRNRMRGWDATGPKSGNTQPMTLCANHDNLVMAANVLGENGYHSVVTRTFTGADNFPADCMYNVHTSADASLVRQANYNTVNDTIPVGEALGAGQLLVTSYLYGSKPSWFGNRPWPWCDPTNFGLSNEPTNIPAGYRAINGSDAPGTTGQTPAAPTSVTTN